MFKLKEYKNANLTNFVYYRKNSNLSKNFSADGVGYIRDAMTVVDRYSNISKLYAKL